jgi:AraC family transcriptional regulator
MLEPGIIEIPPRKLIGKRLSMSFANYRISELWKSFMPRRGEIQNTLTSDLISVAIYEPGHFTQLDPATEFERWAAVEVSEYDNVPQGMETLDLPGGLYAVFDYKGSNTDNAIFRYILGTWVPQSDCELDDRPHFEVLGEKYRNNDPDSEEEIWVPIRMKN